MALVEYANKDDNHSTDFYGVYWEAQTFKTGVLSDKKKYVLNRIRLKIAKDGLAPSGNVTIALYDATGGVISGSALVSETIDITTLTFTPTWTDIIFSPTYDLVPEKTYSIVISHPTGTNVNKFVWNDANVTSVYTGGHRYDSGDSGTTWTQYVYIDFMFEVHGYSEIRYTSDGRGSVSEGAEGARTRVVNENYPAVEGLIAGTTKQKGSPNLEVW